MADQHQAMLDAVGMLGVHVVTDPDPAAAAARMAEENDVEIVADHDHAKRAFDARARAGRTDVVVIGDDERAELGRTAIDPGIVTTLRQLGAELRRIDRIRQRTEDRFTDQLGERLAAGSGVALHPETLRAAAKSVIAAEHDVSRLERDLAALGPNPAEVADEADGDEPASNAAPRRPGRRETTVFPGAALVGGIVLAVLLFFVNWIAALVVLALGIAAAVVLRSRGSAAVRRDREDEELRLGAWNDHGGSEVRPRSSTNSAAAIRAEQRWMTQRAHLETARDRATEHLRSATRHWEALAGPDADVHDIETVIRTRDPHYVAIGAAAEVSPTVRTVNTVRARTLQRWEQAWTSVGYSEAPTYENRTELDAELATLMTRLSTESSDAHKRLVAADAWTEAGDTIDRTLVLVEPTRWLPAPELAELMAKLPAGAEVIVVLRGEPG